MSRGGPVLFYSRCKPYGVDMQQVAREHRCVFFGHFLPREGAPYVAHDPLSFLVSPGAPSREWDEHHQRSTGNRSVQTRNRRLVLEVVGPGSVAMVPWPAEGIILCGRVTGAFRVSFDPARYAAGAERFRQKQYDCDAIFASGELAQGWDVERWVALPTPLVPAWIRRSLFGRSTYGVVPVEHNAPQSPVDTVARLMDQWEAGQSFEPRAWTTEPIEVLRRVRETITPGLFESLAVALLQLEEPEFSWLGVGGSGDGGIDGLASDHSGNVVALLQCKWAWDGQTVFTGRGPWTRARARTVLAHMSARADGSSSGADAVLGPDEIASLLLKHSKRLPMAITLRVGQSPTGRDHAD